MGRTAAPDEQRRPRKPGWGAAGRSAVFPLLLLAATTMLAQGDQSSLSQAVSGIQHRFHASDQVLGLIPVLMAAAGSLGAIPIGVFADRHRRTWLLALASAGWAILMGVGTLAAGITVLFVTRLAVGLTEGTPPVAISLVSDYVQVHRRSEAMGVYQAGAIAGAFIGLVGGGYAVQYGGWLWAFLIWVPVGIAVAVCFLFLHEPARGTQDAVFEAAVGKTAGVDGPGAAVLAAGGLLSLPEPRKRSGLAAGTQDPGTLRSLLHIPTMWLGTLFFTVSQLLLNGLSFWGVTYFERVHHLSPASAGELAALLGAGSAVGIICGGTLADRLLRRGHVNARVHVAGVGAIGATLALAPAFASTSLAVTAPLLFIGGVLLTVPIAPAEALCTDVVLPHLRGRGATVRQVVRTASFTGPYLIGLISDLIAPNTALGLRWAIVVTCPLYAIGGLIMLLAARHYPRDIATVIAYSRKPGAGGTDTQADPATAGGLGAPAGPAAQVQAAPAEVGAETIVQKLAGKPVKRAPAAGARAKPVPAPRSDGIGQ